MPIYEVTVSGPPKESHYVMSGDPKLANQRVKVEMEKRDGVAPPHSALNARQMDFHEMLTLCRKYKPMTHSVDEWFYLLSGLREKTGDHPSLYLGYRE